MNFVVKLDKWLETNGLVHTSTTFKLYSDKELTNLIDTVTDSDPLFLSLNTDIPIGASYYVVATRHFNVENIDYESEVFTITNNGDAINNMILSKPVIIEQPSVIIDKKTIQDSVDTFTLKTSTYRGKGDGHTHTHWFVYDATGLLFVKLRDVDNKTSIEIPKSLIFGKNQIVFKAIHCSNNIESPIGSYTINFNKVNFEITTQLVNIPLTDFTVEFTKIDTSKPMRLIKVNVLNNYNDVLSVYTMSEPVGSINTITIPENIVTDNNRLLLEIYCYDESNKITKVAREVFPIQNSLENHYILDYTYLEEISSYEDLNIVVPSNSVGDIVNGLLWLPNGNKVSSYSIDLNTGSLTKVKDLNGVELLNLAGSETYINYKNGYLIIDNYDTGTPTFMVYKHNLSTDTFTLLHTLARVENKTVAVNNSIVQINLDEFIYSPYDTNKLIKYNFKTNTLTPLKDIPMNITSCVLTKLEDGRILVIGNEDHLTKVYRIEEDDYIDSISIVPDTFIGKDLKSIELVNKDTLIFINNGVDNRMMYFDRSDYGLKPLDTLLTDVNINTVVPMNGITGLLGVIEEDYGNSIPEHTIINLYK